MGFDRALALPPRIVQGDFAGWLRDAMAERRVSARMVATRTGINHSTVTRLLHGDRQPTLATVIALLQLFGSEPLSPGLSNGDPRRTHSPDLSLR